MKNRSIGLIMFCTSIILSIVMPVGRADGAPITPATKQINVLFDQGHSPAEWFDALLNSLVGAGYGVTASVSPIITYDVLVGYDLYILPVVTASLSAQESVDIYNYVQGGGNLFLMADADYFSDHIQLLVEKLGFYMYPGVVSDPSNNYGNPGWVTYAAENFTDHAIMNNLQSVQSFDSASIEPGFGQPLILTDSDAIPPNSSVAVAKENANGGRVVLVGDCNYFYEAYGLGYAENQQFALNIVSWLSEIRIFGRITSPSDGYSTGPASIPIIASAGYPEGAGVAQVEFLARIDGAWLSLGVDVSAPYSIIFTPPVDLQSQTILLRIDVLGLDGVENKYSGGIVRLYYVKSFERPGITENWITNRAYLNQRSLNPPVGDVMCSAASMAMILAMEGVIGNDYQEMSAKAIEMYPKVLINGDAYVYLMASVLRNEGTSSRYMGALSDDAGWIEIKDQINNNHPLIIRTKQMTKSGHFIVAIGYQETTEVRNVITYDPFGEWKGVVCSELGPGCPSNYSSNSLAYSSTVGRWVFYNFDKIFGDYLIIAPNNLVASATILDSPLIPTDPISDEPRITDTYNGARINDQGFIWIPLVFR